MSEMIKNKGLVKELYANLEGARAKFEALAKELNKPVEEIVYLDDEKGYVDIIDYGTYAFVNNRLFDVSGAPDIYDYDADGQEDVKKVGEGLYEVDFYYYNGGTGFEELLSHNLNKADEEAVTETVTIPKAEYEKLLERDNWLSCLEGAGVDNWEGYDFAIDLRDGEEN